MRCRRTTGRRLKNALLWQRFDPARTEQTGGDLKCLLSGINLSLPPKSTHRDMLEAITRALQPPLAIESLSEQLAETESIRGSTIFRSLAANVIDEIAADHEHMYWWVSAHGLNMHAVSTVRHLSEFDELAGRLYAGGSRNGKLTKDLVASIANQLDSAGFTFQELQRAQQLIIAEYNKQHFRNPVRTFVAAVLPPKPSVRLGERCISLETDI